MKIKHIPDGDDKWRILVGNKTLGWIIKWYRSDAANKAKIKMFAAQPIDRAIKHACESYKSAASYILKHSDLSNTKLRHADLSDTDLRSTDLRNADLRNADLSNTDLRYTDFRRAKLCEADVRDADLSYADLCRADLCHAKLHHAKLYHAKLRDTDLREANLREADLRYADLRGADLRGAALPAPSIVLLATWNRCTDATTLALMRLDASAHPNPKAFDDWAHGGDCPYNTVCVQRVANFLEQQELWVPGPPPTLWDAMNMVLRDHCKF